TLAYRGGKAVRGAPDSFGSFHLAATSRTPVQILAHIGDLLDWALSLARGQEAWRESAPLGWADEVSRFYDRLAPLRTVGHLTLLRRLAGSPVRGENYLRADIAPGRVGPRQEPARREFE